ncbi:MAG: DUF4386 family protein [Bellilinea sp.]
MNLKSINHTSDPHWRGLYITGVWAGLAMLGIMVLQITIFTAWPPPQTTEGFFELFQQSWPLGLLSMDLLYIFNNMLLIPIYLALYAALKREAESAMLIALVLGLVGIAAYFASNTSFEMLSLSNQYAAATSDAQRTALLGAGHAMLATYRGTVFDANYVLNAAALLIMAWVMLRSQVFSKTTAWFGLTAGILMIIPSTAGIIGLVFSLLSLVPWAVFLVLVVRGLLRLDPSKSPSV